MRKYLNVIANSIKASLAYRSHTFIMLISVFISFVALFFFWNSIYRQGNQIGTYTLNQIISYYAFFTIFELLIIGDNVGWSIAEEVRQGGIINNLLKPIKYFWYKFSQSIGGLIFRFVIFLPGIILALYLLKNYIIFSNDIFIYLIFIALSVLSFFLYFIVFFIVGVLSFWFGDSHGFLYTFFVIINFLQGGFIPLDLLPKWFNNLSNFLPFKYMFFVPVGVLTQRVEINYLLIITPLLWIIGLFAVAQIAFKKGLIKYESYGG